MIDIELYGGKRGALEHVRARALYALGVYGSINDIEWASVKRLVFVCLGNICRSPYAESRARSMGVAAASFGLNAADGVPADPAAVKNALERGIDLSVHRSARVHVSVLMAGDLISVFEPGQLSEMHRAFGDRAQVKLLGVWARPRQPHIHDPYGRSDRYFQRCFSVIDENIAELVGRLRRAGAPAGESSNMSLRASAERALPCDRPFR